MPLKEEAPLRKMLAGKRTGELVMRNGEPTGIPVAGDSSADISVKVQGLAALDGCPNTDERTQQRLRALQMGNVVRIDRSKKRRELETGERGFDDFLDDAPASCLQVPVVKVLQWLPNVGRGYARKIIADVDGLSEDTRVQELTQTQKYALSAQVNERRYRRQPRDTTLTDDQLREKLWAV